MYKCSYTLNTIHVCFTRSLLYAAEYHYTHVHTDLGYVFILVSLLSVCVHVGGSNDIPASVGLY
jgi:hypothetical protein